MGSGEVANLASMKRDGEKSLVPNAPRGDRDMSNQTFRQEQQAPSLLRPTVEPQFTSAR